MTTQTEALKMALEALKDNQHLIADNERHAYVMEYNSIIEKCEKALAQQSNEQVEPVTSKHYFFEYVGFGKWAKCNKETYDKMPEMERLSLYTHPPVPYVVEPRTAQPKPMNDAVLYLSSLVYALDNAFISFWQSTASWQTQLDEAKEYLAAHGIKE